MIKSHGRNSEKRIAAINVTDAKAQNMIAAKYLRGIVKIVETVWRHIIICQGHKRDSAFRHQISQMDVGDG